jgi:hypothetical protein
MLAIFSRISATTWWCTVFRLSTTCSNFPSSYIFVTFDNFNLRPFFFIPKVVIISTKLNFVSGVYDTCHNIYFSLPSRPLLIRSAFHKLTKTILLSTWTFHGWSLIRVIVMRCQCSFFNPQKYQPLRNFNPCKDGFPLIRTKSQQSILYIFIKISLSLK